jgi:hypothetical protein
VIMFSDEIWLCFQIIWVLFICILTAPRNSEQIVLNLEESVITSSGSVQGCNHPRLQLLKKTARNKGEILQAEIEPNGEKIYSAVICKVPALCWALFYALKPWNLCPSGM